MNPGNYANLSFKKEKMGGWAVEEKIIERLPVTLELGLPAILIGLVIALPVGIYSAICQDTAAHYLGRSVAIISLATPNFWLGIMVMIYPALWWGWSPPMRLITFTKDPPGESRGAHHSQPDSGDGHVCRHDAVDAHHDAGGAPAGLYPDGLGQGSQGTGRDYPAHHQKCPHPDSYPDWPAVASAGRWLRYHENIFNLPGLGRLFLMALEGRDYTMVSGINLVLSGVVMLNILLIDLIYPFLDPRVRYE